MKPMRAEVSGMSRTIAITEGTRASSMTGANESAAKKPRTTDGSEAMISIAGLITFLTSDA